MPWNSPDAVGELDGGVATLALAFGERVGGLGPAFRACAERTPVSEPSEEQNECDFGASKSSIVHTVERDRSRRVRAFLHVDNLRKNDRDCPNQMLERDSELAIVPWRGQSGGPTPPPSSGNAISRAGAAPHRSA